MCATCAAHKTNNNKGSIYMVFDYMAHDLMGLMQRRNHKMPIDQARPQQGTPMPHSHLHGAIP